MCVDIGYKSMLAADGLPRYIPKIKINRDLVNADHNRPHIAAYENPWCFVLVNYGGDVCVERFFWGIVPGFKTPTPLYNARSEKVLLRDSFWYSLKEHRCLLLADGVYEHQQRVGVKKKIPYYIRLKSGEPLLIPALFSFSSLSFSILTRSANDVFREIHNSGPNKHRMPLLCPMERALRWLQKDLKQEELVDFIGYLLPDQQLSYHTVFSIRGKKERPDGLKENDFFDWGQSGFLEQASLFLFILLPGCLFPTFFLLVFLRQP